MILLMKPILATKGNVPRVSKLLLIRLLPHSEFWWSGTDCELPRNPDAPDDVFAWLVDKSQQIFGRDPTYPHTRWRNLYEIKRFGKNIMCCRRVRTCALEVHCDSSERKSPGIDRSISIFCYLDKPGYFPHLNCSLNSVTILVHPHISPRGQIGRKCLNSFRMLWDVIELFQHF